MKNENFEFNKKEFKALFENVSPLKITECYRMKLNSKHWGILTDYILESVKINRYKPNEVVSTAILKVTDGLKQVTCVIKGRKIGLLFGLNEKEWSEIENMCSYGQQLFYRFFKNGLSKNYNCEQKIFYNFCLKNQREDFLFALFCRTTNKRNKDNGDALVQILLLNKPNSCLLDKYFNYLRGTTLDGKFNHI